MLKVVDETITYVCGIAAAMPLLPSDARTFIMILIENFLLSFIFLLFIYAEVDLKALIFVFQCAHRSYYLSDI